MSAWTTIAAVRPFPPPTPPSRGLQPPADQTSSRFRAKVRRWGTLYLPPPGRRPVGDYGTSLRARQADPNPATTQGVVFGAPVGSPADLRSFALYNPSS